LNGVSLGTRVFGVASLGLGIIGLVWGEFASAWQPIQAFGDVPGREALAYIAAGGLALGGLAVQFPRFVRAGAVLLALLYFAFALFWLPRVIGFPKMFGTWGGMLQEFASAIAAAIVYASHAPPDCAGCAATLRVSRYLFGICVISFGVVHFTAISATAAMAPRWIAPGAEFWAILTGVAFVLAGIAILSGILDVLAARLLSAMLVVFGLLVWLPQLFAYPQAHLVWAGNAVNLAMVGAAWIVAELLGRQQALGRG
jgi:uncharacterized membrane protein YphA (DoxX/SURF4 family)